MALRDTMGNDQLNTRSTLTEKARYTARGQRIQNQNMPHYRDHTGHTNYADSTLDHDSGHSQGEDIARQKFGGANLGAAFFGWLVANSITVLMVALLTALGSVVALSQNTNANELASNAGTVGLAGAVGLLVTLAIAYYAGGYVAGRMSRFDGGRQGIAVWSIGLVITIVLALAGAALGSNYNLLQQLNLPSIPVDGSSFTTAGLLTMLAGLVVAALAAMAGGKVGERYHHKVDEAAGLHAGAGHLARG